MNEMVMRVAGILAPLIDIDPHHVARDIITAMREPTEAMMEAGATAVETLEYAKGTWQYMIDAALR